MFEFLGGAKGRKISKTRQEIVWDWIFWGVLSQAILFVKVRLG